MRNKKFLLSTALLLLSPILIGASLKHENSFVNNISYNSVNKKITHYAEEGNIDIKDDPETGEKPIIVDSEIGYDAWTDIEGCRLDKEKHKEEYTTAVNDLTKVSKIDDANIVSAIYDVKMWNHTDPDNKILIRELDGKLILSFKMPKDINKGSNISIYRIHEDSEGNKNVEKLPHKFDKKGYVSIVTDKLSAFAIVKHKIGLLWLIATLSAIDAGLIGGIVLVSTKMKGKKKSKKPTGGKK